MGFTFFSLYKNIFIGHSIGIDKEAIVTMENYDALKAIQVQFKMFDSSAL